jgi:type I restriction enzyme S subunit
VNLQTCRSSWKIQPLGEVVEILDSYRIPVNSEERKKRVGTIPYYGATGQVGWIDDHLFDEELVLLGEDGAPFLDPSKPKAYLVRGKSWVNNHAHVLRAKPGLLNSFLLYQLNCTDYRTYVSGTTRLKLPQGPMKQIPLFIPNEDEQREIVAEIEKQFTRLEAGIAGLRRVQAKLKRYRAAVLKAACEGKLVPTEAELPRQEGRTYETGAQLLERILIERRQKLNGKGKYKEPVKPDMENISKLPLGWTLASVEQVTLLVTDGDHNPPKRQAAGVPHLTAKHVRSWRLDPTECTFISRQDAEKVFKRYRPMAGDLIVTCVGTVGRTAIVPPDFEFSPDRNLAAVRLVHGVQSARYLKLVLSSPNYQERIASASGSTAQPHFYLGDLRAMAIPLPSLAEQQRIVSEVDRLLSVVDELDAVVNGDTQRAIRLRQSILVQAFSGKLAFDRQSNFSL